MDTIAKARILIVGFVLQVIVLVVMVSMPLTTRMSGDTILLRIVPVDPRDLFRGDYVILSYDLSRLPPQGIAGLDASKQMNKELFVSLEPDLLCPRRRRVELRTGCARSNAFG